MGRFVPLYNLLEPLVEVLRPLPKPALLPPLILFLGLGDPMKLTVVGLGVFFPVLINTVQGVRGVDPSLVDTGRTFRCGTPALLLQDRASGRDAVDPRRHADRPWPRA